MPLTSARVDRRGFLARIGFTAVGVIAVIASPGAQALVGSAVIRNHPLYRVGTFRRRTMWMTSGVALVVLRRKAIRSNSGRTIFDRNAFEVIFARARGKELGSGTVTMTNEDGVEVSLFLTQTAPQRYSAIINRQGTPRSNS